MTIVVHNAIQALKEGIKMKKELIINTLQFITLGILIFILAAIILIPIMMRVDLFLIFMKALAVGA